MLECNERFPKEKDSNKLATLVEDSLQWKVRLKSYLKEFTVRQKKRTPKAEALLTQDAQLLSCGKDMEVARSPIGSVGGRWRSLEKTTADPKNVRAATNWMRPTLLEVASKPGVGPQNQARR